MEDCFKLLHFHLGSQIPNIRIVKGALNEAARVYAELVKAGAGLEYLDVGGGLGVDYDGSQTNFESSVNYTLEEYANDVVYHIQTVCDDAGVKHPTIVSESGRAIVAYHSVLVFNVLGVSAFGEEKIPESDRAGRSGAAGHRPARDLPEPDRRATRSRATTTRSRRSTWRSTCSAAATCRSNSAARPRTCTGRSCVKLKKLVAQMDDVPEDLQGLDDAMADTYFCNFSLFQSMPGQLGDQAAVPGDADPPAERRRRRSHAVLGDITCDSDGKIDQFIDRRDVKRTLPLHTVNGEPYYLGVFLVGAYQEILGDLHNLFGDTHAVHVSLDERGSVVLDAVIKGDTVSEVLDYVEFDADMLVRKLRHDVELAVREGQDQLRGIRPAAASSTKTACRAIPTWKSPRSGEHRLNREPVIQIPSRSRLLDRSFAESAICQLATDSLLQHLLPRRPELIPRLPFRHPVRVGDAVAHHEQQLRVFDGAAQIPVRLHLVRRLVIVDAWCIRRASACCSLGGLPMNSSPVSV